jgi:hypothetical protein
MLQSLLEKKKKQLTSNQLNLPFLPPKFRKVLKVSSINFNLKSDDEQFVIIQNFGKFLNSLSHPVQILCDSKIVNPDEWLLKVHNQDYYDYLKHLVDNKNTTEKEFYVAFSAKTQQELNEMMENIESQLRACRLVAEEINPNEPTLLPKLRPGTIRVGDYYHKTFMITDWPYSVSEGWLEDLYNINRNISLSMFIHPVERDSALNFLNKSIARLESTVVNKKQDNSDDGAQDEEIVSALNMRDELYKNEGNFFYMSFYVTVKAKELDQLKHDVSTIKRKLRGLMIKAKETILRQDDGFRCSLPHGVDYLKNKAAYTFTTTPLKRFFPFVSTNIVDSGGILIGKNLLNSSLIFLNHFKYFTASMIVLGKSGAGKSYTVKAQISKLHDQGIEVTILDREGEFAAMQEDFPNLIIKRYKTNKEYKDFLKQYWSNVMNDSSIPRFLVIDEFWEFMKDNELAEIVQEIAKKCRKRWLGLCVITQEIEDMLVNSLGRSIINASSVKILLKVETKREKEELQKVFDLTNQELSFLTSAGRGEGILFADTNHVQFQTLVSEKQHKLFTTDPNEGWVA